MRIALIGDFDVYAFRGLVRPPGTGGYRLSPALNLARGFRDLRVPDVHYVVVSREVDQAGMMTGPFGALHCLPSPRFSGSSTFYLWRRRQLLRKLAQIQPDVVHAQGSEEQYAFTAVMSPYRHVVTFHGIMHRIYEVSPPPLFSTAHVSRWLEKIVIRKAANVICLNGETEDFLHRCHSPARFHRVANAVAPCFFDVQPTVRPSVGFTLLFVATILPRKGLMYLVEALPVLRKKLQQPVRLVVMGGGVGNPYQITVARRAAELGVDSLIEWRGLQLEDAVAHAMTEADAVVLPSFVENMPMCIGEAMAAGLPVVSTATGGIPEMVEHGKTGLLVSPGNAQQLTAALLRLLADPVCRIEMGRAGRAKALQNYTPRGVAEKTLAVYESICRQTGR